MSDILADIIEVAGQTRIDFEDRRLGALDVIVSARTLGLMGHIALFSPSRGDDVSEITFTDNDGIVRCVSPEGINRTLLGFPKNCCEYASIVLLDRLSTVVPPVRCPINLVDGYFRQKQGVDGGNVDRHHTFLRAAVAVPKMVVDITADQFGATGIRPVYVGLYQLPWIDYSPEQ